MEKKWCFATNNKGKLQEIKSLLQNHTIVSLQDIGCNEELPETHNTLKENSLEKAEYIFKKYKINCFADDSGLEVDALNGAPGPFSARFAGLQANSIQNMELLLQKLKGIENRKARFRTVITLLIDGTAHQFEGTVEGHITETMSGNQGFGYDPIFIPEGYSKTFAEFTLEEKNAISHRGIAVRKLIDFLQSH